MPGALQAGNELDQGAVAADEKMCGYFALINLAIIGVLFRIQAIAEQLYDAVPAVLAGGEADVMYHQ